MKWGKVCGERVDKRQRVWGGGKALGGPRMGGVGQWTSQGRRRTMKGTSLKSYMLTTV